MTNDDPKTREEAERACVLNGNCEGILDNGCNAARTFSLCSKGAEMTTTSSTTSCVYLKLEMSKLNISITCTFLDVWVKKKWFYID